MADYSKWDKLVDSDDEVGNGAPGQSVIEEERETLQAGQNEMEQWLRRQISRLETDKGSRSKKPWEQPMDYGNNFGSPPEIFEDYSDVVPCKKITKEERKTLAMFLVINHFDEGLTNLDRHPQLLEFVRHDRWLENDPGTLELLCRIHNASMKRSGNKEGGPREDPNEHRLRSMVMTGINTLAAAKRAGMAGGLLEMVTAICTPATDEARAMRKKWQKKEYAKDALFDSLFPDLKRYKENVEDGGIWKELLMFFGFILVLACVVILIIYSPGTGKDIKKEDWGTPFGLKWLFGEPTPSNKTGWDAWTANALKDGAVDPGHDTTPAKAEL